MRPPLDHQSDLPMTARQAQDRKFDGRGGRYGTLCTEEEY